MAPKSAPSRITIAYVVIAHAALLAAALLVAWSAEGIAASFLHPHALAGVHLVTLGWLTSTALGATYAVLPMALGAPMPVRWPDVVALILATAGASGVISHMLLGTYSGVAWSGGMVALGGAWVGLRALRALGLSRAPRLQRFSVGCAYLALVTAAVLGALVAIDRDHPLFAGGHLRTVSGHAHLALVGWLGLLTVGIGHRLVPMLVPAAPIEGSRPAISIGLLLLGAVALPAAWLTQPWPSRVPALCALPILAGTILFALDMKALRGRRKPKAKGLPRRDPALAQVAASIGMLALGAALGAFLLATDAPPGLAALYGVLVVVGGFGGMVLGVGLRLWPLLAWLQAFARGQGTVPPRVGDLPSYAPQWAAVLAWQAALVGLGVGVACGHPLPVRLGGICWSVAAVASLANLIVSIRRARRGA